ncbi:MAG: hypothetical protein V4689_22455 [Verrucomicrobiota bacterium]
MKMNPIALLLTATALTGHCLALTPITEDFQASKLDKTRWLLDKQGKGRFAQSNEKLNFVVSAPPTGNDFASIELKTSQPGMYEDWEMILDMSNSAKQSHQSQAGCGFFIINEADYRDYLFVNFFGQSGIQAGVYDNSVSVPSKPLSLGAAVAKGAIRISFSQNRKLMTFFASLTNKEEGYEWFKVGTFAPKGAKKADVKAAWNVNSDDGRFRIQLFGFGVSQAVRPGKITIDNFSLQAP